MSVYNLWKFDTLYSVKMILGKVMDAKVFALPPYQFLRAPIYLGALFNYPEEHEK